MIAHPQSLRHLFRLIYILVDLADVYCIVYCCLPTFLLVAGESDLTVCDPQAEAVHKYRGDNVVHVLKRCCMGVCYIVVMVVSWRQSCV